MAKTLAERVSSVTFDRRHFEWIAWTVRQMVISASDHNLSDPNLMDELAKEASWWADELESTNPRFDRNKFVRSVVTGR